MHELPIESVNDNTPPPKLNWFVRFLIWLAGADAQILASRCPEDIPKILAQVGLLVGTFIYSSAVLTVISNRLFSADQFSIGLMLGAIGVSAVVSAADAYVFLHCSYIKEGIHALQKSGWEIPLPAGQAARTNLFLANRLILAGCWAYFIGLCLCLVIFGADIDAHIAANDLRSSAPIVTEVSRTFDAEIKAERESIGTQEGVVRSLSKQSTALRQNEVDWIVRGSKKRRADPVIDGRIAPFEARLEQEQAKLDGMKKHLAELVEGRNTAVRKAVATAPNHVALSTGFLARVRALDEIASENTRVKVLTIVLETVAVGIEMAAVLAKLLGFNPTIFSILAARAYHTRREQIADEMEREIEEAAPAALDFSSKPPTNDNNPFAGVEMPANDNASGQVMKRGRGRPRGSKNRNQFTNGSGQEPPEPA